jgi:hypothetical protein
MDPLNQNAKKQQITEKVIEISAQLAHMSFTSSAQLTLETYS